MRIKNEIFKGFYKLKCSKKPSFRLYSFQIGGTIIQNLNPSVQINNPKPQFIGSNQ
jgi:ribosomal protein L21E